VRALCRVMCENKLDSIKKCLEDGPDFGQDPNEGQKALNTLLGRIEGHADRDTQERWCRCAHRIQRFPGVGGLGSGFCQKLKSWCKARQMHVS